MEIDHFVVRVTCQEALVSGPLLVCDQRFQSIVKVFGPGVEEEQTGHLTRIGGGEEPAEEGALGLSDQQVRRLDLGRLQCGMQIRHHFGSGARIVIGFVAPFQTRSVVTADADEFRGMDLHRRPDRAVVAVARFEDHCRPAGADAAQEDQAAADIDGAADDRIFAATFGSGEFCGATGLP